ncbi:MAG: hypothetical protein ABI613_10235 [Gemmatimonadota bacterium]
MRNHFRSWFALILVAGCRDGSGPGNPDFLVTPGSQWSGGTIQVQSHLFVGLPTLPTISAGGLSMSVTRSDDSTLSAVLPILPSGNAAIEVDAGSDHFNLGNVQIAGFRRRVSASSGFAFEPVIATFAPAAGPVAVAGIFPPDGSLGLVDLRTAVVSVVSGVEPPDFVNGHGAGVSFTPRNFILRDSTGALGEWQVYPTLAYVDTTPDLALTRQIAHLHDQVWIVTHTHLTDLLRPGQPDSSIQIEDPWRISLFPAADRAVINGGYIGRAPVFEMSTGNVAYTIPIDAIAGAASTSNGSRLFVVGDSVGETQVRMLDASTGSVIQKLAVVSGDFVSGLALSANGLQLFMGTLVDSLPGVIVFDVGANSLTLAGRLIAATDAACPANCNALVDAAVVEDAGSGTIFLVSLGDPGLIWEFDLRAFPSDLRAMLPVSGPPM